jgi:hypothetical protein
MMELALEEIIGRAAPPDLSDRIAVATRGLAIAPPPRRPSRLAAGVLLAASLLVGAFVLWKILATPERPPVPPSPLQAQDRPPKKPPWSPEQSTLERLADDLEKEAREGDADPRPRAEAFLKVEGPTDTVARARFKAALCYRSDALAKWAKNPRDPQVAEGMDLAVRTLAGVAALQADPQRQPLLLLAYFEQASLCLHESLRQAARAQTLLELCAKWTPEGDPWLARVWELQIRCHLETSLGAAADVLDRLIERFPEAPEAARMSRMVALRLDEATQELVKAKGDSAQIEKNLRRVSRYYGTWVGLGPMHGLKITLADVLSVAESLYSSARFLNHLGAEVSSVGDLRGQKLAEPALFKNAAYAIGLALGTPKPARDRIELGARRARCLGFAARDAAGWKEAELAYLELLKPFKLVTAAGTLDGAVSTEHQELLGIYIELGNVQMELGKAAPAARSSFDDALTVYSNVLRVIEIGSQRWWYSKYMILALLVERGEGGDLKLAEIGLENLERSIPDFDQGRFGMKDRFLELKKKLDEAMRK